MSFPAELDRRFREAAAERGLLDVAFDTVETPVGTLAIAVTPLGLAVISFETDLERTTDRLARSLGARVLRAPSATDTARRQLDEYFAGTRRAFDLPLDLSLTTRFQQQVLHELRQVPYGVTETYGGLASRVGNPSAARAVGGALHRNPLPIVLPCHRVVGSRGELVGYAGGLDRKRALLAFERGGDVSDPGGRSDGGS